MEKQEIKVGLEVWVQPIGYNVRRGADTTPIQVVVASVGRKYFQIKDTETDKWNRWGKDKFNIDTLIVESKHRPDYQIYFSLEDIENERLVAKLKEILGRFFQKNPRLPLDKLKQIGEIIGVWNSVDGIVEKTKT